MKDIVKMLLPLLWASLGLVALSLIGWWIVTMVKEENRLTESQAKSGYVWVFHGWVKQGSAAIEH